MSQNGTQSPGVTNVAQALQQLQGAGTAPGMAGAPTGSTGFVPPHGALQASQAGMAGGAGGPGGFQQMTGAPAVGGNPGANGVPAQAPPGQPQPMPQWQRGLMGLLTGSSQYGAAAPGIHAAVTQGLQAAMPKPMQGGTAPQMQMARRQQMPMQPVGTQNQLLPQAAGASLAPWMQN